MWFFDRHDLKEAVTLLMLNDKTEKDKNDLELKKLIRLQFDDEPDNDMRTWAMEMFDEVYFINCKIILKHVLKGVR